MLCRRRGAINIQVRQMKSLVVAYSLSGQSRAVAAALARELGAELEEIRCDRYTRGFWGFIRAAYDSLAGRLPPIESSRCDPTHYDLVVIGGPIWASHPATPVRAYMRNEAGRLSRVAFFLTYGGSPPDKAFREMGALVALEPKATLAVREKDVKDGNFVAAVSSFASALHTSKAA